MTCLSPTSQRNGKSSLFRAEKNWDDPLHMVVDDFLRQTRPSYLAYRRDERIQHANNLLGNIAYLITITNLEFIEPDRRALFRWLMSIRFPSKALIPSTIPFSSDELYECKSTVHMPPPQIGEMQYRMILDQLRARNPAASVSKATLAKLMQYTDKDARMSVLLALRLYAGGRDIDAIRVNDFSRPLPKWCADVYRMAARGYSFP